MNEKQCTRCKQIKQLDEFYVQKQRSDGKQTKCKTCSKADVRHWQKNNDEMVKRVQYDTKLWQAYRLRTTDVEKMLVSQNFKCLICEKEIDLNTKCVDHNHSCCPTPATGKVKSCGKCVRGLLCRDCNFALGWYEVVLRKGLIPNIEKYLNTTPLLA